METKNSVITQMENQTEINSNQNNSMKTFCVYRDSEQSKRQLVVKVDKVRKWKMSIKMKEDESEIQSNLENLKKWIRGGKTIWITEDELRNTDVVLHTMEKKDETLSENDVKELNNIFSQN
tara:strand:- start:1022 stop:1384 length:363 start_codon:yes stop_codon:yes gene_type:complete